MNIENKESLVKLLATIEYIAAWLDDVQSSCILRRPNGLNTVKHVLNEIRKDEKID